MSKYTFQAVKDKANIVHNGFYTYPEQAFKNGDYKLRIVCPIHGEFSQLTEAHLGGRGCRPCGIAKRTAALRMPFDDFVRKATAIHGGRYEYITLGHDGKKAVVEIVCKEHGNFEQSVANHLSGSGCPKCGRSVIEASRVIPWTDFLARAKSTHGDKYEYPIQAYTGISGKIRILCKAHGEFLQTGFEHVNGGGCNACGGERAAKKIRSKTTLQSYIAQANKVHNGRYYYTEVVWRGYDHKINVGCFEHGLFSQYPANHKNGNGCPTCGVERAANDKRDDLASFIIKARLLWGDEYEYPEQEYKGTKEAVKIICKKHGVFELIPNNHLCGQGCKKCHKGASSKGEIAISEYFSEYTHLNNYTLDVSSLESTVPKLIGRNAKRVELDIFFDTRGVAVEFNGLYWHSESRVGKGYHKGKTDVCREAGIDLIQVFEDEWNSKREIVKSIIGTRLGIYTHRYFARKTELVKVSQHDAGIFYDENHVQGRVPCKEHYGLKVGGELVAMASFGNRSHLFKNNDDIELIRFCTKLHTQVVGGLSKLLAVHKDVTVKTYCDLRLFNGGGYKAVGFKELHTSPPSYFYVKGLKRYSRFNFQKHKLEKALETFNHALTEVENMAINGYSRIFDCGTLVMELPPRVS